MLPFATISLWVQQQCLLVSCCSSSVSPCYYVLHELVQTFQVLAQVISVHQFACLSYAELSLVESAVMGETSLKY